MFSGKCYSKSLNQAFQFSWPRAGGDPGSAPGEGSPGTPVGRAGGEVRVKWRSRPTHKSPGQLWAGSLLAAPKDKLACVSPTRSGSGLSGSYWAIPESQIKMCLRLARSYPGRGSVLCPTGQWDEKILIGTRPCDKRICQRDAPNRHCSLYRRQRNLCIQTPTTPQLSLTIHLGGMG